MEQIQPCNYYPFPHQILFYLLRTFASDPWVCWNARRRNAGCVRAMSGTKGPDILTLWYRKRILPVHHGQQYESTMSSTDVVGKRRGQGVHVIRRKGEFPLRCQYVNRYVKV